MPWTALRQYCGSTYEHHHHSSSPGWNSTSAFYLSPCFQQLALLWVPCGFLWLFTPLEIHFILRRTSHKIPWSALNICKLVIGLLLVVTSIIDLFHSLSRQNHGGATFLVDFVSPVVRGVTFMLATILILFDKLGGVHSSGILFIFWLLLTLADAITYHGRLSSVLDTNNPLDELTYATTVVSFPLLVAQTLLSAFADTVILNKVGEKNPCPLKYASCLSVAFFGWFDSFAWRGFRKPLSRDDLWPLAPELKSAHASAEFDKLWRKNITKMHPYVGAKMAKFRYPSIKTILFHMFWGQFLIGVVLKFLCDILGFVSPFMLRRLIAFVSTDEPAWHGYMYAAVIFLAAVLQSVCINSQFFRMQAVGLRARAAVMAAIYKKSLRMSSSSRRSASVGEIVNLMSVDCQRLMEVWPFLGYAVTTPFQVAGALYLLWDLLGPAVLAGVAVVLLVVPLNTVLANAQSKMQATLMKEKDHRTKLMNEILSGIKVLKLYAWELSFSEYISRIRQKELRSLRKILYIHSFSSFIFQCTPFLISLATFATYVLLDERNVLDATKAFVSLSLFDMIRFPLHLVPMIVAMTIQMLVSVQRIDCFMEKEELDPNNVTHDSREDAPVVVRGGTFAWSNGEEPVLRNIDLRVAQGSLVAVVGTVGAGKSSLLSALLGEMERLSGRVNVKGSIGYVSQQPWIQNNVLRENILFGRSFDEKLYERVIDACALKTDLTTFPGGDLTEIGEKGINLSGGQKQRVSLARAAYSDADIYLLDDPLSAVDSHVGKHIFEKLIGAKGLLRDKTRILVTHSLACLPHVDSIVVLSGGTISEVGSYKQLLARGGAFAEFIMTYITEREQLNQVDSEELLEFQEELMRAVENQDIRRKWSMRISRALSSDEDSPTDVYRTLPKRKSRTVSVDLETKMKASKLTTAENMETGEVQWAVYVHYLRSIGVGLGIIILLMFIGAWTSSVGSSLWLSVWSQDKAPGKNTSSAYARLRNLRLGVFGTLGLSQAVFAVLGSMVLVMGSMKAARSLHSAMLLNVLRAPMSFFDTTPLGRILNRFSRDVDVADFTIPSLLRPCLDNFLQVLSTIVVISLGSPLFLTVFAPLAVIYYLIQRVFIQTSRQVKRLESASRSPIYSHFSETITGLSTIRAFGRQEAFLTISEKTVDENDIYMYPFLTAKRWLGVRLEVLGAVILFSASLFAVLGRNRLDPGMVGLTISYALSITFIFNWLVRNWTEFETNLIAIERMKEYTEIQTEAPWKNDHAPISSAWPENGNVTFHNYSVRYREGLDLVLKKISCNIYGGEKIGIVGRTGAGKSSLTLALFRILEASDGSITIDGIDISQLGLHELRSRLTIIPQDPVLFSGSLRLNLDPFDKFTDEQLWEALELSHLREFAESFPGKLQHEIQEGGENLSVGQRQLVCLTRAILKKTKILILDEATAAVDMETDDLIQTTIRHHFADCTVLTIAHRLNTIMDSHRIMVLDNGTIVEFDTPANLLDDKHTHFFSVARDAGII